MTGEVDVELGGETEEEDAELEETKDTPPENFDEFTDGDMVE